MEITIDPGPQVDFSYLPRPVTTETTTVNFFNTTSGINNYLWTFDNLGSAESTNATFTFPDGIEGNYAVTLFAENTETGCNNELTRIIDVVGQLIVYVPNAFTPNGDGINELFAPVVRNFRPETYEFSIYSRNGELIFKSQDPEEKWNGSVSGSQYFVQNEVYIWQLAVGDIFSTETKKFNGKVTVIR
jgi:gliding motility-associated-like protein